MNMNTQEELLSLITEIVALHGCMTVNQLKRHITSLNNTLTNDNKHFGKVNHYLALINKEINRHVENRVKGLNTKSNEPMYNRIIDYTVLYGNE